MSWVRNQTSIVKAFGASTAVSVTAHPSAPSSVQNVAYGFVAQSASTRAAAGVKVPSAPDPL